ncbi:Fe-only nitrogenase accessory protein AnfO [Ruminiclostridium papyrosolvens]|uniref:Fe-only nitrogenase accessory protein AnfO n=1 Tax=Ruminiclostridium papyrosolvens C7 TaxID=1330534 RepID=U4R1G7_9FIRM|nr:Fe-only nitrogenase accessory protein AnfO [Ruminiclostridium papyrosolvens]EPR12021.1 Fe-only nitrogenase accessory protein AnfO [Ruminiclostridium papyrosolvens C7]
MVKQIAVIVNDEEELSPFEKGSLINIYNKNNTQWQLYKEVRYYINTNMSLSDLRENIKSLIMELEDCKIIVGKVMSGLAYNIFDRMGFAIFEAKDITSCVLDDIYNEVSSLKAETANSKQVALSPVQTEENGVFYINLMELQAKHPEISSKKALKPFLETTPFFRLEVICSHVPPWFDNILPELDLSYSIEENGDNKYKVSILNNVCSH